MIGGRPVCLRRSIVIMDGALWKAEVYCHFPEWVKRQYGFMQDILKHQSFVYHIPTKQVVQPFINFRAHCIPPYQWGLRVDDQWHHVPGYIIWYGRVSHPKILPPIDGSPPRPTNRKQIIAEEHAKIMPESLEIIKACIQIADQALAQKDELNREDLMEALSQIQSAGLPSLTYSITRTRGICRGGGNL